MARSKRNGLAPTWGSPGLYPADGLLREHVAGTHRPGSLDECEACRSIRPLLALVREQAAHIANACATPETPKAPRAPEWVSQPAPDGDTPEPDPASPATDEAIERRLEASHFDQGADESELEPRGWEW